MKKSITTIFNDFNIIIDSAVKKGTEEYLAKQVPKTEMSVSIEDSHQKAPTPIVQRRSVIETKEEFAHENSFCLKVFSNKIKSRSDLRIPCDNLVDELKTLKLISGEKCTTQLLDILCGKPLSTITDKLNWVGSYKNLNVFINEIVKRENLIKYVGRDHWTITIECFLKNGGPIDRVKLKKPDSKTYPMEKNIKELIDDFEQKITSPRTSDN